MSNTPKLPTTQAPLEDRAIAFVDHVLADRALTRFSSPTKSNGPASPQRETGPERERQVMHRRHMANGRTRQERLTLFDREDIGPNSQAERERLERYVEELLRDRRRLELENAALRHSLAEGLPWVAFPADPAYPCTDCRDTIPYFYCDLCRAQWNKKQRELDELRGGPDFPATESEVGS